ncbi:hypothetical protein PUN28_001095 [Cardiocondyla obscurior]|uniref:Protein osiris 9 n=1 Tax=Cardiocondyla obscurior TaxID=286306 RepID=A0AAW2H2W0_9HYME
MRTMRTATIFLILGLALRAVYATTDDENTEQDQDILECVFAEVAGNCFRTRLARQLDRMEVDITGERSKVPISTVIEQAGDVIAELTDFALRDNNADGATGRLEEDDAQEEYEEGRKKKKFKKKHLQKILGLVMLLKAKLSLLLQLISTHFQLKFFVIAVISLLLNAARFWIEIKKNQPSKVIYYEHAQHQHHYDHDEHDHGYWGRSSNETPQDLAYRGHIPTD